MKTEGKEKGLLGWCTANLHAHTSPTLTKNTTRKFVHNQKYVFPQEKHALVSPTQRNTFCLPQLLSPNLLQ